MKRKSYGERIKTYFHGPRHCEHEVKLAVKITIKVFVKFTTQNWQNNLNERCGGGDRNGALNSETKVSIQIPTALSSDVLTRMNRKSPVLR